jgi:hypothetical protein
MLASFVAKNWKLTSLPLYFTINTSLAYYKYQADGIKTRHVKIKNFEVIGDQINVVKGKFQDNFLKLGLLTMLFGGLCVPIQLVQVILNHYKINIDTTYDEIMSDEKYNYYQKWNRDIISNDYRIYNDFKSKSITKKTLKN